MKTQIENRVSAMPRNANGLKAAIAIAFALAMLLTGMSANVHAIATLQISDGSTTVSIADNAAGDTNPVVGAVTSLTPIGNFMIGVTTGLTMPVLGSPVMPTMDVNSVQVSIGNGGTITIAFSEVNYGPLAVGSNLVSMAIGGVTGGSVSWDAYYDTGNTLFAQTSLIGSLGAFSGGAFAGTTAGQLGTGSPFSITSVMTINHGVGTKVSSFDAIIEPVPEPGTIMLLGTGVVGLILYGRRRKA